MTEHQKSRKQYIGNPSHVTHLPYHSQHLSQRKADKDMLITSSDISNLCEFFGSEDTEGHCMAMKCDGKYHAGRFCYVPYQSNRSKR